MSMTERSFERRDTLPRRAFLGRLCGASAAVGLLLEGRQAWAQKEVLPKHVTPEALRAVTKGLDYLAAQQAEDGAWTMGAGGQAYPVAMTGLAGTALLAHGQ